MVTVVVFISGPNALMTTSIVCDSGHLSGTKCPGMILLLWLHRMHRMPLWQHDVLLWLWPRGFLDLVSVPVVRH